MAKINTITTGGSDTNVGKQEAKLRVQFHEYATDKVSSQTFGGIVLEPTTQQITDFCDVIGHFSLGRVNTVTKIVETVVVDNKLEEQE
ncbi:hypothetical protein AN643_00440 [Candidatus Epulonipiscioides saccharophilum]|nr:hypothetical protein AN644_00185 [Epulopiscium sp. SCG-C06WGA-EpuloA1]ONI47616.1 hypothetical protein AN644_04535 [Epulopiscium sp. SCG-C06WGA-EpuloA1]ONI47748.1 hypothetical protein AN643_00440 [Epulopiscium sp. SCG-B10WGA-EpuloB]